MLSWTVSPATVALGFWLVIDSGEVSVVVVAPGDRLTDAGRRRRVNDRGVVVIEQVAAVIRTHSDDGQRERRARTGGQVAGRVDGRGHERDGAIVQGLGQLERVVALAVGRGRSQDGVRDVTELVIDQRCLVNLDDRARVGRLARGIGEFRLANVRDVVAHDPRIVHGVEDQSRRRFRARGS